MKIKVMAERQLAQKIDLKDFDRPAWIRVRSPGANHEQEVHSTIEAIQCPLVLYFHDLDLKQCATIEASGRRGIVLFSESDAQVIWAFIHAVNPDFLLINCEAGISRSASIAAAVARKYGTPGTAAKFESFPHLKNSLISEKMHQTWLNNVSGIY